MLFSHARHLSETAGHDVGTKAAPKSYPSTVLPHRPDERAALSTVAGDEPIG